MAFYNLLDIGMDPLTMDTLSIKEDNPDFALRGMENNPSSSIADSRESVVKYQMALKEDEFTELRNFTIFCGTWNVNGQSPPIDGSLADWLQPKSEDPPPEIYALGFQELDLSKEAFVFNESPKEEQWYEAVYKYLPQSETNHYKKVKLVRLVGIMLIVFVQEKYAKYVRGKTRLIYY